MSEGKPDRYYGKYRGTVINNVDPMRKARIQVEVPDVLALVPSSWAMPCVPFAGIQSGAFVVPAIGAGVWVEFEQGDPNRPIWVGGYWSQPQAVPPMAHLAATTPPVSPVLTMETKTSGLSISDTPLGAFGNVCLRSKVSTIIFNDNGIQIIAPSVSILTPKFSVNQASLTVGLP